MKRSLMQFKCLFCVLYAEFCPWWTPGVWVSETFFLNKSTLVRLLFPVKYPGNISDWSFRVTFSGLNVIGLQVYV